MIDDFHIYLEPPEMQKLRKFCNAADESGLFYSMYPRISGPPLSADKKSQVCFTFRTKYVAVEPRCEQSYGWAFAVSQEICRHMDVKEVYWKSCQYTPEEFIRKHPFAGRIELHQRILEAMRPNDKAPVAPYHAMQIKVLNDLYRKFKVAASRLFAGTTVQVPETATTVTP